MRCPPVRFISAWWVTQSLISLERQFTTCVKIADVLLTSSKLPEYAAVMACDACASNDVVNVALPLTNDAVPKLVVPSFNVTVPAGAPAPGATAATVTLNVTVWPNVDGFGDEGPQLLLDPHRQHIYRVRLYSIIP